MSGGGSEGVGLKVTVFFVGFFDRGRQAVAGSVVMTHFLIDDLIPTVEGIGVGNFLVLHSLAVHLIDMAL